MSPRINDQWRIQGAGGGGGGGGGHSHTPPPPPLSQGLYDRALP